MSKLKAEVLFEKIKQIADPRREHQKFHLLFDILVITICATICGVEHWTEIEEFGEAKREWFASFLSLENGVPSHDTFRRVFILMDTIELKEIFVEWVSEVVSLSKGVLVNIDGQEFVWEQRAGQGEESLKYGECLGFGAVGGVGASKM